MKKRTIREINEGLPGLKSEKVEILSDELDRVLSLKELFTSDGGKELIKVLRNNCVIILNKLVAKSKDNPDLPTVLGLISAYSANIDLLAQLRDIKFEQELRDQLDEAVRDAVE